MDPALPRAIRLDLARNLLEVEWADGKTIRYDGPHLRWICPCAACRGHAPGEVEPPSREACAGVRLTGASPVGAYALRFGLSDGHESGIYTYEHLRAHAPT
jgi:DUF971 family protein